MSIKSTITGLLIGTLIGYYATKTPKYALQETKKTTYLKNNKTHKKYEINTLNQDTYLGGLEHNLKGIKELAHQEGQKQIKKQLEQQEQRNRELEQILQEKNKEIKEQQQKIKKRRTYDKIEETKEKITNWYNNKKRKTLE